jgi:hypothetical protein
VILRLLRSRTRRELTHTLARVTPHLSSCCPHQHHGTLRLPGLALANGCGLQMTSAYVMALTSSSPIIRHFLSTRNSTAWEGHFSLSSFRPLSELVTYSHAARLPFTIVSISSLSISLVVSCFGLDVCNLIGGKYSFLLLAHSQCYLTIIRYHFL